MASRFKISNGQLIAFLNLRRKDQKKIVKIHKKVGKREHKKTVTPCATVFFELIIIKHLFILASPRCQ